MYVTYVSFSAVARDTEHAPRLLLIVLIPAQHGGSQVSSYTLAIDRIVPTSKLNEHWHAFQGQLNDETPMVAHQS